MIPCSYDPAKPSLTTCEKCKKNICLRCLRIDAPNIAVCSVCVPHGRIPVMGDVVDIKKKDFLNRYNRYRTDCEALSKAIAAAAQHNGLYNTTDHGAIRSEWENLLVAKAAKYVSPQTEAVYEQDIEELASEMNRLFKGDLRPSGFKISHSQKSMGVFLKHLWCMGKVATPPQCPVDAQLWVNAGLPPATKKWTHINTIVAHGAKVDSLKEANTTGLPLAEWELLIF